MYFWFLTIKRKRSLILVALRVRGILFWALLVAILL